MPSRTILSRKGNKVTVPDANLTFEIDPQVSALSVLGTTATEIYNGDKVIPPFIFSKDGTVRPYLQRYRADNNSTEQVIDSMLLMNVELAELQYYKVCKKMQKDILPRYQAAFQKMQKCKVAHLEVWQRRSKKFEYREYSGDEDGVSFGWLDEKPRRLRNQHIAKEYKKAEDLLSKWYGKSHLFEDVLTRALWHNLPKDITQYDPKGQQRERVYSMRINGRQYVFLRNRLGELSKFVFYEPVFDPTPIVEMEVKNDKNKWPFKQ